MIDWKSGTIEANGIRFQYLEHGKGPLMLMLHGFPDYPGNFRHQLEAFGNSGYRVVAPYMRGYGPSAAPSDAPFQSAVLGYDAIALIERLGAEQAVLVGHDWGAVAAYAAALLAPERISKLVGMSVPYGPRLALAFITDPAQQRRSWYMFFFQMAFAEAALAHDDFAFIDRLWGDWSPGFTPPQAAMAGVKETFRMPGTLGAALGYYRHTLTPAARRPEFEVLQQRAFSEPIQVPTLYLHGEKDGCVGVEMTIGMEAMFPKGLTRKVLPACGHFLHLEQPDAVNAAIRDFLA